MLVIGSQALRKYVDLPRASKDIDFICTLEEYEFYKKQSPNSTLIYDSPTKKVLDTGAIKLEFDIAQDDDSNYHLLKWLSVETGIHYAPLFILYALKMSHRFKKDSPHFYKTMDDIKLMRSIDSSLIDNPVLTTSWYRLREKETYNYSHPKLNVTKENFFKDDEVPYEYDHDSIHRAVAFPNKPAYLLFKPADEEVLCSRTMFDNLQHYDKILSVYEEAAVLALERSVIPFATDTDKAFRYALMKLCTSISSGWWRSFAWEHHNDVLQVHSLLGTDWYLQQFNKGKERGDILPFKENVY